MWHFRVLIITSGDCILGELKLNIFYSCSVFIFYFTIAYLLTIIYWSLQCSSVIPTSLVMHFLSSSFEESDQHSGFGWLGLTCKYMFKGSVSDSGISVESISSLSGAHKIIETSDILLAIDNIPIGDDGTGTKDIVLILLLVYINLLNQIFFDAVLLRNERVDFRHLVSVKKPYENILIKLLRDGEVRECNVTLIPVRNNFLRLKLLIYFVISFC